MLIHLHSRRDVVTPVGRFFAFCPLCRDVVSCHLFEVRNAQHVYVVQVDDGSLVGCFSTCDRCGAEASRAPGAGLPRTKEEALRVFAGHLEADAAARNDPEGRVRILSAILAHGGVTPRLGRNDWLGLALLLGGALLAALVWFVEMPHKMLLLAPLVAAAVGGAVVLALRRPRRTVVPAPVLASLDRLEPNRDELVRAAEVARMRVNVPRLLRNLSDWRRSRRS